MPSGTWPPSHASPGGIRRLDPFDVAPLAGARADRVELSETAQLLARMREMPDVRQDRIDMARSAIERGLYETDHRLDLAIDRLIEDMDLPA
jgi:hypothetical protein